MNNFSYVTASINAVSSYKNQYGLIASDALRILEEDTTPSIYNAIINSHTRAINAATDHKFNGGPAPVAQPIAYLDFVQTIMNKICSLARQDLRGKRTEDFDNGIDFTQELTDQIGFSVDPDHIAELVDEDLRVLTNVHARIGQKMPYIDDIPALRYHAESTKLDDGSWVKTNIADSFDEAVSILNEKGLVYAELLQATAEAEDNAIDFTASNNHPSPEQLKATGDKFRASVAA
jgi:hypothetical protein